MSWWEALRDYLDERDRAGGDVPDPWAELDLGRSSLTEEQVAFLVFDQPPMPRLGDFEPPESVDGSASDGGPGG
jgi:hypothetical protein